MCDWDDLGLRINQRNYSFNFTTCKNFNAFYGSISGSFKHILEKGLDIKDQIKPRPPLYKMVWNFGKEIPYLDVPDQWCK